MEKGSRCPFAGPYAVRFVLRVCPCRDVYTPSLGPAGARPWCAEAASVSGSTDDERIMRFLELAGLVSGRRPEDSGHPESTGHRELLASRATAISEPKTGANRGRASWQ